jgi:hypothetical protein
MTRSLRALLLATVALTLPLTPAARSQEPEEATVEEVSQPVSPELLEAKRIFILNTVMDFSLASAFTTAIMDWERFEVVFSEDEADLCFALSAQDDYRKQEIETKVDSDVEGMRRRTLGTMRTLDNLYLKVFVPGGEDLWRDEAAVGEDSQAAVDLVTRLREAIEKEETTTAEAGAEG